MSILIDILASGVTDANGEPLSQGKVYVYQPGTTSKQNCYTDADLSVQSPNPLTLDDAGRAEIYVNDPVRLVIEDADGVSVDDIESVGEVASLAGDVTLGTDSSDTLTINSRIDRDLIPKEADKFSIGDAVNRWKHGYFEDLPFEAGTRLVFYQAAAPTGWTRVTDVNDRFIRVVSAGSPGTTGGSWAEHNHTFYLTKSSSGGNADGIAANGEWFSSPGSVPGREYFPLTFGAQTSGTKYQFVIYTGDTSLGSGSSQYADVLIAERDE